MKKHIGTLLTIVGIIVIAFPFVGRFIANYKQEQMMEAFLEKESNSSASDELSQLDDVFSTTNTVDGQEQLDADLQSSGISFDGAAIEEGDTNGAGSAMTLGEQPDMLGIIEIPAIDLKAPIAQGADLDTLRFALGHMVNTADLNTIGNAAVAGHRSHSFGIYFNRLDEVSVGDEIKVNTGNNLVDYIVYDTQIVLPDDTSVLKNSSKNRVLTLITCDPVYNPTHRLIVHAIDASQIDDLPESIRKQLQ